MKELKDMLLGISILVAIIIHLCVADDTFTLDNISSVVVLGFIILNTVKK